MLCRVCRRQVPRAAPACPSCGAAVPGAAVPLDLVLPDGKRVKQPARLSDGDVIRIGDLELRLERRRDESEAGKTVVIRAGTSLMVPAVGKSEVEAHATATATTFGFKPKVRPGWALKRLDASEGE